MTLKPEAELVVLCASPLPADARIRALLDGPLDWSAVLDFAGDQRLQQQFTCRLRVVRPEAIPLNLEALFQQTLRRSLLLTRELVKVLDLLDGAGIPALPFKGPGLALKAYGSLAFRSFDDLDILIPPADVWQARDVLQAAGFTPKLELKRELQANYLAAYDEYLMRGPGGSPLVELHWGFVPPHFGVTMDFAECWAKREQLPLANRTIPSLDTEDLLLVLSLHGAKHGWSHLGLMTDAAWLIARNPVIWPRLIERARKMGVLRMLLLAVNLVGEVFGVKPEIALETDPEVGALTREIIEGIFGLNGRIPHDEKSILRSGRLHMRMRERMTDRLRYALRLTTRAGVEDWEAIDLPASLSFLYPVLRFPRLVTKYAAKIIR